MTNDNLKYFVHGYKNKLSDKEFPKNKKKIENLRFLLLDDSYKQ